jgi:hypothetical protein
MCRRKYHAAFHVDRFLRKRSWRIRLNRHFRYLSPGNGRHERSGFKFYREHGRYHHADHYRISGREDGSFNDVLIFVSLTALFAIVSYGPIVGEIKRLELTAGALPEKAV